MESGTLSADLCHILTGLWSDSGVALFHNPHEYRLAGSLLGTLFSQQRCNPFSQGGLGTCLCRQPSSFFADLKGGRCQWEACQENDCFGTRLVILACAIARTCQPLKMWGVEKSRGYFLRTLCFDNPGSCRRNIEFQGQLYTCILDLWRRQPSDVCVCSVFWRQMWTHSASATTQSATV